jgi:hypothetical protein
MAVTHECTLFWQMLPQKATRIFSLAPSHELEEPFRTSKSLVVKVWKDKVLVLGCWRKTGYDIDTGLAKALRGDLNDKTNTGYRYHPGERLPGDSSEICEGS